MRMRNCAGIRDLIVCIWCLHLANQRKFIAVKGKNIYYGVWKDETGKEVRNEGYFIRGCKVNR